MDAYPVPQSPLLRGDLANEERLEDDAAGTLRFEPHTLTHPNLTTLGDRECRQEIEGSKVALEKQLGRDTFALCFPGGFVGSRERDQTEDQ